MPLARTIRRGAFLKARFGVNGTQKASRSFGTVGASGRVASDMAFLLRTTRDRAGRPLSPSLYQPIGGYGMPQPRQQMDELTLLSARPRESGDPALDQRTGCPLSRA